MSRALGQMNRVYRIFYLSAGIEGLSGPAFPEGVFDRDTPSLDSKLQARGWILLGGDIRHSLTPSTHYHSGLSMFEGKKKSSGTDIARSATTFHSPCMRDVYCTSWEISGSARAGIEGNAFVLHHELAEPKTEVAGRDT
ncbi:hypothetical protein B0H14DRAFT_2652170 [Mycena olivaceomarginata]|nr:hypothetical protein B0H14DRAFT_2652170 [Mycena olivaceomarginata]